MLCPDAMHAPWQTLLCNLRINVHMPMHVSFGTPGASTTWSTWHSFFLRQWKKCAQLALVLDLQLKLVPVQKEVQQSPKDSEVHWLEPCKAFSGALWTHSVSMALEIHSRRTQKESLTQTFFHESFSLHLSMAFRKLPFQSTVELTTFIPLPFAC